VGAVLIGGGGGGGGGAASGAPQLLHPSCAGEEASA
jgi:hypothetical protein